MFLGLFLSVSSRLDSGYASPAQLLLGAGPSQNTATEPHGVILFLGGDGNFDPTLKVLSCFFTQCSYLFSSCN